MARDFTKAIFDDTINMAFTMIKHAFSKQNILKKKSGYTLAEVLITLSIVGLVAEFTIPGLIKDFQKNQMLSQLKKNYTSLAQAVRQSENDNGPNAYWDWGDSITVKQSFLTYWAPYLKIIKYCETSPRDCGYSSSAPWKYSSRDDYSLGLIDTSTRTAVILSDGTYLMVYYKSGSKLVYVDLNAGKAPNMLGKDVFLFSLDQNKGFMPYGYSVTDQTTLDSRCSSSGTGSGSECAAKIIKAGWQMESNYPW